ncbi:cyclase family protein [Desulfovibrio aminophilus]|uniref:cyclase family protein n=1 Tax=Desulfovibrio aminophilus TaxID=81425 RepID=UPI0004195FBF|nr:cyclase family protein [Desulfovibrio aminophilus]
MKSEDAGLIDLTLALGPDLPVWPGTPGFSLEWTKRLGRGDSSNDSRLSLGSHMGTHLDAPLHVLPGGLSAEVVDLDAFLGPAQVVHLPGLREVAARDLEPLLAPGVRRLLVKTDNSRLWDGPPRPFATDFTALTQDAAELLVRAGVRLVGVDYLSVQRFGSRDATHAVLLGAGVAVLEGLDLRRAEPGIHELLCLPMKVAGAEAVPVRAVLRPLPGPAPREEAHD